VSGAEQPRIVTRENWRQVVARIAELEHPNPSADTEVRRLGLTSALLSRAVAVAMDGGADAMLEHLQERLERATGKPLPARGYEGPTDLDRFTEAAHSATAVLDLLECAEDAPNPPPGGTTAQACMMVRTHVALMMEVHEKAVGTT